MANTGIKPPIIDMALAAMVMNLLSNDRITTTYVTACLLNGMSLQMLHDLQRPHDEIIQSTINTLELIQHGLQKIMESTPS